ncbi:MAG: radical SAM protein [Nitrospirota bacterium]|nr:radical SAM protein [Nitrospirota bacterium]
MQPPQNSAVHREHTHHPRVFALHRYVYAVLSRRSGGISIGVNLNPDKRCNFDCVYCQVDRTAMPQPETVPAQAVLAELEVMLKAAADGSLFRSPRFADLPPDQQVVKDVALSGDGEPTSAPAFREVAEGAVWAVKKAGLNLPVVLITNCAGLDRAEVAAGVDALMISGGEVWAKLDAGSEAFYAAVCGTRVPFPRVLANIAATARRYPVTLQVCRFRLNGALPPRDDLDAWIARAADIARISAVAAIQLYTVARTPSEAAVTPLTEAELEAIAADIRAGLPSVPVTVYA